MLKGVASANAGSTLVNSVTGTAGQILASPTSGAVVLSLVAPTTPTFLAANAGAQSISSAQFTQVTLGTEIFDTNSNFASSRFTPTVAGYYQINCTVFATDTVAVTGAIGAIYKNGAEYIRGNLLSAVSASNIIGSFSSIIQFNGSTDYVELWGFVAGTSPSFGRTSASAACIFSGSFLHA